MSKSEALRGYLAFNQVFAAGTRVEGILVRCFFLLERGSGPGLRLGYSVPGRALHAVWRNRVRRLMREAFARERERLAVATESSGMIVKLLFQYRPDKTIDVRRLTLTAVHRDIAAQCRSVTARLQERTS